MIKKLIHGVRKYIRNKNFTPANPKKAGKKTHTSKIAYTPENDGHDNPARMRHAITKARHASASV